MPPGGGTVIEQLFVELGIDATKLRAGLESAIDQAAVTAGSKSEQISKQFDKIGQRATRAGRTLTMGLTAPIIALGTVATKLFLDFEEPLNQIVGLVGVSREQVNAWKEDILDISRVTARGPAELARALYFITSAGVKGAEALEVLDASARAATAGLGETSVIADAATSVMNAYGKENITAAKAVATLVAAVREGKAEASTIAPAIGRIIPIAANLGVSFDQVAAAVAVMTRTGLDANEAITALRGMFSELLTASGMSGEALEKVGLSAAGLRQQLREKGLLSVLRTVADAFAGDTASLVMFMGNLRALTGFMNLTGQDAEAVEAVFASLAGTTEEDLNKAFAAVAEGPGFQMKQALNLLRVEAVRLGDTLAPMIADIIVPGLNSVAGVVGKLVSAFTGLPPSAQKIIVGLAALAAAIGPLLMLIGAMASGVSVLIGLAPAMAAAWALITGPIGLIVIAIAAVVLALYLLRDHWDEIWEGLKRTPEALLNWLKAHWVDALIFLFAPGGPLIVLVRNWEGIWAKLPEPVKVALDRVGDVAEGIANGIISVFEAAINFIIDGFNRLPAALSGLLSKIPGVDLDWGAAIPSLTLGRVGQIMEFYTGPGSDTWNRKMEEARRKFFGVEHGINEVKDAATGAGDAAAGAADKAAGAAEKIKTLFDILKERADLATSALNYLRTALSELFGRPTREGAILNERLARLRLQRAQMVVGGATDKQLESIDKQIASVQKLLDLRAAEQGLMQARMDSADAGLAADAEQLTMAGSLIERMGWLSAAIDPVVRLYERQKDAMQAGLEYLLALVAPTWAGEFQHGGIVPGPIGAPALALVHGGEPIGAAAAGAEFNLPITLNIQSMNLDTIRRLLHAEIDNALNEAARRSYLAGAPLSSAIR